MESLCILLAGAIDYAGLFPPAKLDMASAVRNYGGYRRSEHGWALGRFIVPVSRLPEFEKAKEKLPERDASRWRLSALVGTIGQSDVFDVRAFNDRQELTGALIETLELKASSANEITDAAKMIHPEMTTCVEIPIAEDPKPLIVAIRDSGLRAKVRTGGVTRDAFPTAAALARFIHHCAIAGVPFKATAGLHHPLRSTYRLTYELDSPKAMMYGFLNVLVASGVAKAGGAVEDIAAALEEQSPSAFRFEESGCSWGSYQLPVSSFTVLRGEFAISFGSCSFTEPIQDLQSMGLL